MDIKELCRLCQKYSGNKVSLQLEYDFKKRVDGKWDGDSKGMERVNSKIAYLEGEMKMLQQKIERVANVDFNWL